MKTKDIIKSLNLTGGEVMTLEKMEDRMEFEAMPMRGVGGCDCYFGALVTTPCINCPNLLSPCSCDGPVGYINCHPYK
jgi:hypothetical protein